MDIENIDVVGAQFSERGGNGVVHGLDAVTDEAAVLAALSATIVSGVLCGNNDLVAYSTLLYPFFKELLG